MAYNKEGSREHGICNLGAGTTNILKKEQGVAKNWEMEQRARETLQGARGKVKQEQGAKRDEKGAVKISKKERVPKNGRQQEEWGKMSKGAGSIDPP